tara:strand:- start:1818 stop:2321 length:504 start_codon:yes stop_codon:yes gene_type:complete
MSSSVMQNIVAKSVAVDSLFVNHRPIFGNNNAIVKAVAAKGTSAINSGAITIPANALITRLSIIVTTKLEGHTGTVGHKVGTLSDDVEISAADSSSLKSTSDYVDVGVGTSTDNVLLLALDGVNKILIKTATALSAGERDIFMQVDSSIGSFTAGTCQFIVEYTQIE